ncbi:hypothetical protein FOZ60_007034 [Perkinsus olseni]|uniref:Uncharacterized protein n=1 Tax=Perkinsus olseni TaxID=32597 RepID=A0A7J6NMU0_PEROL|nr:hypothetical protein FOZ60_007034 [Perkinsus olseni]
MPIFGRPSRRSQTPRRLVVGDGRTGASRQQQQGMLEPFPAKVYHPPSESEEEEEREGRQPSSSAESISPISDKTDGVYRRRTTVDNAIHMSVPLHYNSMPWTPERPPSADVKPFPQSKDHWRTPATTASSPSGVALISSASMAYETRMEVTGPRQPRLSPLGVIRPPFPALQRESFRRLPTGESSYSPLGYDTQDESQDYSPANVDPQWIPLGAAVASGHLPPPDDVVESRYASILQTLLCGIPAQLPKTRFRRGPGLSDGRGGITASLLPSTHSRQLGPDDARGAHGASAFS